MAITADKKDGKLTGRFRVEVQLAGHRMRGRFNSMEEARKIEGEWKRKLASGDTAAAKHRDDLRSGPKTLSQLLAKAVPSLWNSSDHGLDAQRKVLAIIEHISDIRLADLTTRHIDDILAWLRGRGAAPGTINRYLSALHAVLKWGHATGRGYVPVMPEFQWEDEDEGRIRSFTKAEEKTLLGLLAGYGREDIAAFVAVAIDTGCRRGELLGAEKHQLDGSWLRLWGDKTKTGYSRSVPLTPRSQALLGQHMPFQFEAHTLRHFWNRAKKEMGLEADEDFVLHACRHTCATRLVERGVNLRIIQTYLGHRAIQTTLRYAHTSDDMLVSAAAQLADYTHPEIYPVSVPGGGREGGVTEAPCEQ